MRKFATLDIETDPFKHGRMPMPFACGFFDGQKYLQTWGDDCIARMLDILKEISEPHIIYAHNGGKFDYYYLSHEIREPLSYINGRLVKAALYKHELRDSFKILPFRLAEYKKDIIDYDIMERNNREKHKEEITNYLRDDCVYLYELIAKFREQFGDALTIGTAAMQQLKKVYKIKTITPKLDYEYRQFFHGGRCECFQTGEIKGDLKLYDVNSMYPYVMDSFKHPIGAADYTSQSLPNADFYLANIIAESNGAFPVRENGLHFPHGINEFFVTSHEIKAAFELGIARIIKVKKCYVWNKTQTFSEFIRPFINKKIEAEHSGDKIGRLLAKLITNNGYGKFAQNPERFHDFKLFVDLETCAKYKFIPCGFIGNFILAKKQTNIRDNSYYNVAVAASVTGAARSVLMHAIINSENPIYCDTDSLVCTKLNAEIDSVKLGAWKIESEFDTFYCAGKKLYAAQKNGSFYKDPAKTVPIKCAAKGVPIKPETIAQIAQGQAINVPIDAPSLHIGQTQKFITRTIARTGKTC